MPSPQPPLPSQLARLPLGAGMAAHRMAAHRMAVAGMAVAGAARLPTLLLVEDSRYASEVIRLYARSLGLHLRRAADLQSAQDHLHVYLPDIVLIDLGLPDGRGEALIEKLARAPQRPPLIIAMSGQAELKDSALAAGADVFLEKPMPDLAAFHALLIAHFPGPLPLLAPNGAALRAAPDRLALQDDLDIAASVLSGAAAHGGGCLQIAAARTRYVAALIDGVAGMLGDSALQEAARFELSPRCGAVNSADWPHDNSLPFRRLRDLVNERLRSVRSEREI